MNADPDFIDPCTELLLTKNKRASGRIFERRFLFIITELLPRQERKTSKGLCFSFFHIVVHSNMVYMIRRERTSCLPLHVPRRYAWPNLSSSL